MQQRLSFCMDTWIETGGYEEEGCSLGAGSLVYHTLVVGGLTRCLCSIPNAYMVNNSEAFT